MENGLRGSGHRPRPPVTGELLRPLGEGAAGRDAGLVGALDRLAGAGLPVPEGVVLTRAAHARFLKESGLRERLAGAASEALRSQARGHPAAPLSDEIREALCEALAELGARSALVLSEYGRSGDLSTIPDILDAVRAAWLAPRGLERQIRALAAGREPPLWPVLVQKELRPELAGWTDAELRAPEICLARPGREELERMISRARSVLGRPVRLEWGFEGGRWHILGIGPPGRSPAGRERFARYVDRLELGTCAGILAASPVSLAALVWSSAESRVEAGDVRSFEEVIRTWTLEVLSRIEGG
jgi:hypothetical protein